MTELKPKVKRNNFNEINDLAKAARKSLIYKES